MTHFQLAPTVTWQERVTVLLYSDVGAKAQKGKDHGQSNKNAGHTRVRDLTSQEAPTLVLITK